MHWSFKNKTSPCTVFPSLLTYKKRNKSNDRNSLTFMAWWKNYDNLVWSSVDTEYQLPCNSSHNELSVWAIMQHSQGYSILISKLKVMDNQLYHTLMEALPTVTYIQCQKYSLFLFGLCLFCSSSHWISLHLLFSIKEWFTVTHNLSFARTWQTRTRKYWLYFHNIKIIW